MIDILRSEICKTLEAHFAEPTQRETMLRALSREGFALHPEGRCTTGLFTLEVYRAIRSMLDATAFRAAVATELYMEAAFMFDHVADQELDQSGGLSAAEELILAVSLMACGAAAACEAAQQASSDGQRLHALLQLHRGCISSCSGQLLDAQVQKLGLATTEEALRITRLKSGSTGRSAAALAANIATDDPETIRLFEEFGFNLFTYLQLIDDLRDACPESSAVTDLGQLKKTLPLVYFYNSLAERTRETDSGIIPSHEGKPVSQEVRQGFKASGAEVFSAIIAETFLNRAKSNLAALKNRTRTVEGLEQFISSLEFSPNEIFAVP